MSSVGSAGGMESAGGDIVRYVALDPDAVPRAALTAEERRILETVNERVGARESLESVIDFLADATRAISPCDRVSVAFIEEQGQRIVSHYTRAFYEPVLLDKGYAEDLAGSSLAAVLERGTPRIINDLERYLELRPESRATRLLLREGVRASMTCPLRVEGRIVGLLFRSARRPGVYDERQALRHLAVAERLSQAVEKTYRIAQLAEANRAYFELLGFVAHELKSPVASMLTDAGLLRDGYLGQLAERQRECLAKMIDKGQYLLNLVNDYLNLSRLEGGQLAAELRHDIDLAADVLAPAVEIVRPQIDARRMRLVAEVPPDLPPATLDPQLVRIVLVNLLSNAAKYGRAGGEIRVTATPGPGRLTVAVWNEGPGFPASQRGRLFRRFSRLDTPELRGPKGTGVGLYTAWRIVQLHGGRIDAASEPGQWARFSFSLPQPAAGQGAQP